MHQKKYKFDLLVVPLFFSFSFLWPSVLPKFLFFGTKLSCVHFMCRDG
jgi:hypothetical protein